MVAPHNSGYFIGKWYVEPHTRSLKNQDTEYKLPPNIMETLAILAQNYGQVVSKETLHQHVWGNTIVSDDSISKAIAELRRYLNDSAKEPKYIETVTKKGYRLIIEPRSQAAKTQNRTFIKAPVVSSIFVFLIISIIATYITKKQHSTSINFSQLWLNNQMYHEHYANYDNSGRFLVSQIHKNNMEGIAIRDLQLETYTELFSDKLYHYIRPKISPSGQELAFFKISNDSTAKTCELIVYTFLSKNSRSVANCMNFLKESFSWSHDNTAMYLSIDNRQSFEKGQAKPKNPNALFTIGRLNIATGRINQIIRAQSTTNPLIHPVANKDDQLIVYIEYNLSSEQSYIKVFNKATQKISKIYSVQGFIHDIKWSPDDTNLYYSTAHNVNSGLWLLDIHSKEVKQIKQDKITNFDFHPNGQSIAISSLEVWSSVYSASKNHHDAFNWEDVLNPKYNIDSIDINYAGDQLLMLAHKDGSSKLWQYDLISKVFTEVNFPSPETKSSPKWSSDGKKIAFITHAENDLASLIVLLSDPPYNTLARITNVNSFSWLNNSNQIMISQPEPDIQTSIYTINTQELTPVTKQYFYRFAALSENEIVFQPTYASALNYAFFTQGKVSNQYSISPDNMLNEWYIRDRLLTVHYDVDNTPEIVQLPINKNTFELLKKHDKRSRIKFTVDKSGNKIIFLTNTVANRQVYTLKPVLSN
ncbi:winged helix-turn-helix domain-containing protein [Catenovulum sediminis]|uniref:winged helix-turn-helix domain-containing protein n=1 Tax=Catenovulum sediminis TaxID=1740262 RepID=UPI00163D5790|nr:winged helix-turn-helix domain-containing protein [Catenovulum sediminis]